MRIYNFKRNVAILNKNAHFKKISHEKCVNFADFQRSKRIFMQPIAEKDASFADFQRYNRMCTQPTAKKSHIFQKISV